VAYYYLKKWKEFRDNIIEIDNYQCCQCGRSADETVLQVHHKRYIKGRLPWEYATEDCETLCRACHAAEHGIIMPVVGWEYCGDEDLGDMDGICDKCGTGIRYVFYVFHPAWGFMSVGTYCCDAMTDSNIASNHVESVKRFEGRQERFIRSKRWKTKDSVNTIKHASFEIEIREKQGGFFITIHNQQSKTKYNSLHEAKAKVFDVIESGKMIDYLKRNNIQLPKARQNKNITEIST
jgi:ribosomal protein S27AE